MGRLGSAAGWIIQGLIFATLLSLIWLYWPPANPLESFSRITFCFVTAWLGKKLIEFMILS